MASNYELSKGKVRRELIEKHVRAIESGNLISLKFQEKLIKNNEILDDEIKNKIKLFLRPCDLEEISIERSERGKCGWLQCKRNISKGFFNSKSRWMLDKNQGQIIDTSLLSLFCSTNCYYCYLNLSLTLTDSPPHLRIDILNDIQEWLNINISKSNNVENNFQTNIVQDKKLNTNIQLNIQNPENVNKIIENNESETSNVKEKGDDLINLLRDIKISKNSELNSAKNVVKQFEYLDIEDEQKEIANNSSDTVYEDDLNQDTNTEDEYQENEEYTYKDLNEVLEQNSDEGEDSILLMSQFYNNLSPEAVVLDLLTSLISNETKSFIHNLSQSNTDIDEKTFSSKETHQNEFNTSQNDRKNVFRDTISTYISSVEWISSISALIFTIYQILETFIFPFPIPNLKYNCIELLIFVLIDVILDKKSLHFKLRLNSDSMENEINNKFKLWREKIMKTYDQKFINNIKLLFER